MKTGGNRGGVERKTVGVERRTVGKRSEGQWRQKTNQYYVQQLFEIHLAKPC